MDTQAKVSVQTVLVQTQPKQPSTLIQAAFAGIKKAIDAEIQHIKPTIPFDQWFATIEHNYFHLIAPDLIEAFKDFYISSKVGTALWKHGPEEEPYHNIILSNGTPLFNDNHFFWVCNGQKERVQLPQDCSFLKEIKPGLILFADQGKMGTASRSLHLFNIPTKEVSTFDEEHFYSISDALLLSENLLVTYSYDRQLKLWDINTKKCIRTIPGIQATLAFLHFDGSHLIGVGTHFLMKWTFPDFKLESSLPGSFFNDFKYSCVPISNNKFVSLAKNFLTVYDFKMGTIQYKKRLKPLEVGPSVGPENFNLACPLDSETFAAITNKGSVHIFDIETGKLKQVLNSVDKSAPESLVMRNNALVYSINHGAKQRSFIRHTCKSLLQDAYNAAQAKNKDKLLL